MIKFVAFPVIIAAISILTAIPAIRYLFIVAISVLNIVVPSINCICRNIANGSITKTFTHRAGYVEDEDNVDRSCLAWGNAAFDILLKRHLIRVIGDMLNGLIHDNAVFITVRLVWLLSVRKCRERQEREDHADAHEKRKSAFSYIHYFSSF